jgi:TolB-like protein
MRTPLVARYLIILNLFLLLSSAFNPAGASQVVTDATRQWAQQAVSQEASQDFKPAANTIAVLYFQNRSRQPQLDFLQMGMTVMLITDLAKIERVQVVERTHLQALVQELKLGASGIVTQQTAPRVGRLLGARFLVGGDISKAPANTIKIGSDVLDVPQKNILGRPASSGPLTDLLRMEKELLFEIIDLLQLELTEAEIEALRKPVTFDIKALRYLIHGIQSSDSGNYAQAAGFYQQALKIDPELEPAQSAIRELKTLKLIGPGPGSAVLLYDLRKRVSVNRSPIPDQITKRRHSEPASVLGPGGPSAADVRIQW